VLKELEGAELVETKAREFAVNFQRARQRLQEEGK
jgi:hypothetical protein